MSKTGRSRLSRFLPKFLRGDKSGKTEGANDSKTPVCDIYFLDDSHHEIQIKGSWKGNLLQEKVCELLSLHEKDYFGLRFVDSTGQTHWLDGNKSLSSQFKGSQTPHHLYFGVKFYAADPCKLREEITRYLFFLQVKQDILRGRLPVTFDEAAELCAYAVQSELGDFDPHQHTAGYVSEFCFVPNQTDELERRVAAIHRRLIGLVPLMAEYRYLDKVKWLDMYGVDLHPVLGEGNVEYFLGLTPTGIVVYKNKNKINNYFWPRINKVTFKGKIFIVKVKDRNNEEHVYAFELPRKTACKHLWKCCVQHHAFFRLSQTQERSIREKRVFRSVSTNRRSGRSERQAISDNLSRHPSNVVRLPSKRQARRISSDPKLNAEENLESQYHHDTGLVTMLMRPEPVRTPRHRSLPELQGQESPRSVKSAPWETNFDYGLYTHGKESPVSERSNRMKEQRNHRILSGSDSESGVSHRRKYFPNRRGSDNDSDVSVTRRRRRDIDSDSASDLSSRYPASQSYKSAFPVLYPFHDKDNCPNGSIPSLHSAPAGESKQRRRRRRSKSPSKHPPEELKQHFEYGLKDTNGLSVEELKEIPFVNVETKASLFKLKYSPKLRQKVKAAKQRSLTELDQNRNQVERKRTSVLGSETDKDLSIHSRSLSKNEFGKTDNPGYKQEGDVTRISRRPHSYHPSQTPTTGPHGDTLSHSSHHAVTPVHYSHHPNSAVTADSCNNSSITLTHKEHLHPPHHTIIANSQSDKGYTAYRNKLSPETDYTLRRNSGSVQGQIILPKHVRSHAESYPSNPPASQDTRSLRDKAASVTQSLISSPDKSKSYHCEIGAPRSTYAASSSSYYSHGSHHLYSQGTYKDNHLVSSHRDPPSEYLSGANANRGWHAEYVGEANSSGNSRPRDPSEEVMNSTSTDRAGSQQRHSYLAAEGQREKPVLRDDNLQPQPLANSDTGGFLLKERNELQSESSFSNYRAVPRHKPYADHSSVFQGNAAHHQLLSHTDISFSSLTSPPQNYHHHRQQQLTQPPQRSDSFLSSSAIQPFQNSNYSHHTLKTVSAENGYGRGHRPRSHGHEDDQRLQHSAYESDRAREYDRDRSRGQNQGEVKRSRHRKEADRSRLPFHEEQHRQFSGSSHQREESGSQRGIEGLQPNDVSFRCPPTQHHHQPEHMGTLSRSQDTPPRYQGTPPSKANVDLRYSRVAQPVHAREQSEGGSSQASVVEGVNFHHPPRPLSIHSGSHYSAMHAQGTLTSERARQLLNSVSYNPDLCTEL